MVAPDLTGHMSTGEAARVLGVSQTRVYVLCKAGRLRYVEMPLGKLVDRGSLDALARARAEQPEPAAKPWRAEHAREPADRGRTPAAGPGGADLRRAAD